MILKFTHQSSLRLTFAIIICLLSAGCSKRPQSSVLYYNRFGQQAALGANKFQLGPHEGLLGVRQYYFACDSAVLPDRYRQAAMAQASYLKAHPQSIIQLQGFADAAGSPNYNLVVGQQRADSVATILRLRGLGANQVYSVSYGSETSAPYTGQTQEKDCRVDVVYLADS